MPPPPPPSPPPAEEKPLPLPPRPKPKPPKPKPQARRPEPELQPPKPKPTGPLPERDVMNHAGAGVATSSPPADFFCADACSGPCAYLPSCQPPPAPPSRGSGATVHLRSGRLPTPLIAVSASLLAVSAALLLALLLHRLLARRRRRRNAALLAAHHGGDEDAEGGGGAHHHHHHHQVLAGAVAAHEVHGVVAGENEDDDGVHHVWYIRTKGLDERAIAAIAAVVYDGAKKRGGDGDDGGSCAVCLAEFRNGETLRLLPRCAHAFHRGCIDTWLRAHVNCPLCRAPVLVTLAAGGSDAAPGAAPPSVRRQERNLVGAVVGGVQTEETAGGGSVLPERAVRRAASMVALPRRAWPEPDVGALRAAPASSSGREEDMTGLGKIRRLLKFSESALEMAGIGVERSVSFGGAGSCQRLPPRSGPSAAAAGVNADETSQ